MYVPAINHLEEVSYRLGGSLHRKKVAVHQTLFVFLPNDKEKKKMSDYTI